MSDDRPQQFKARDVELAEVRERMHADNLNWAVSVITDTRDLRDPQLLGESLLRMRRSGRLCLAHNRLEAARAIG